MNIYENTKEAKERIESLYAKERILKEKEVYKYIYDDNDPKSLTILIKNIIKESLTFEDIIRRIIVEYKITSKRFPVSKLKYLSTKELRSLMRDVFKENGMVFKTKKGTSVARGSMSSKTTQISYLYNDVNLKKSAWSINREFIFVLGFGLKLTPGTVNEILCHYLHQIEINFKDYKEVIYYWCLKNNYSYDDMIMLMEKCEDIDPCLDINKTYLSLNNTRQCKKEFIRISNENELINYAQKLYVQMVNPRSKSNFNIFFNNIIELQENIRNESNGNMNMSFYEKITDYDDLIVIKDREIEDKQGDTDELHPERIPEAVKKLKIERYNKEKKIRQLYYTNFFNVLWDSYDKNVVIPLEIKELKEIFSMLDWTESSFMHKMYDVNVTREDIIISFFLVYAHYCETEPGFDNESYKDKVENYINSFLHELAGCNLGETYNYGNPLDLFLIFCLSHKKPYSFFLKIWEDYINVD